MLNTSIKNSVVATSDEPSITLTPYEMQCLHFFIDWMLSPMICEKKITDMKFISTLSHLYVRCANALEKLDIPAFTIDKYDKEEELSAEMIQSIIASHKGMTDGE